MNVRNARTDDIDALVTNCIGVALESEGLEPDASTVRAAIHAAITDPNKARYFVAETDGVVVGSLFVTYEWSDWRNGWYWWIQGVYVHPDHRRSGVYTALYNAVHAAANDAGDVRRVRLYVHKDNPARAAYEAHGMHLEPYRIYDSDVSNAPSH